MVGRDAGAVDLGLQADRLCVGVDRFFLLSQVVPGFLAPLLVPRLEPFAPRRLLPALYWLEAILFGILAWLTSRFDLAPVLVLVLVDGSSR